MSCKNCGRRHMPVRLGRQVAWDSIEIAAQMRPQLSFCSAPPGLRACYVSAVGPPGAWCCRVALNVPVGSRAHIVCPAQNLALPPSSAHVRTYRLRNFVWRCCVARVCLARGVRSDIASHVHRFVARECTTHVAQPSVVCTRCLQHLIRAVRLLARRLAAIVRVIVRALNAQSANACRRRGNLARRIFDSDATCWKLVPPPQLCAIGFDNISVQQLTRASPSIQRPAFAKRCSWCPT